MWPVLVRIPWAGVEVPTWGVVLLAGLAAGIAIATKMARRDGIEPASMVRAGLVVVATSLVGVNIMGLVDGSRGRVLYGGILAGIGALVVSSRWFGIGWRTAVDAGAVGLAIGIAIGRLGCLAGGCCTGTVCTMPWGVIYPAAMVDAHGLSYLLPRHPVQVYESILAAAIGCFLIRQHARRAYAGQTALTFLVLYPAARFVVEFWRADDRGELAGVTNATGLSPAQIISFATFAIALPLLVVATRGARRKASATDGPEALERSRPTAVHP